MIVQIAGIAVGGFVVRKVVKAVRTELDFRKLKNLGKEMGIQYVPGESVEAFRERVVSLRDKKIVDLQ